MDAFKQKICFVFFEYLLASDIGYFCFGGGGSRGIAYAGAVDEWIKLTKYNTSLSLKGASGTSIGALYAAALVVGLKPEKMMAIAESTHLVDIVNIDLTNILSYWGLDSGQKLLDWVESHIGTMTFYNLYQQTGRLLELAVTNINTGKAEYLSFKTSPNMKVAEGIVTSMALPIVFCPRNRDGNLYCDGGLIDNYPIHRFPAKEVLGFRVHWNHAPKLDSIEHYFSRIGYCATNTGCVEAYKNLPEEYKKNSITIDCGDVSTINWRISKNIFAQCVTQGRQAVRQFILERNVRTTLGENKKCSTSTQTDAE